MDNDFWYGLDEKSFRRNYFYGIDFSWYAIDSTDSIAIFTSGHNPIPRQVFNNNIDYLKVDNFMGKLPIICNSSLSSKYKNSIGNYSSSLQEGKRGLYCYEEQSNWTYKYDLVSLPSKELKLLDLPKDIRDYLAVFRIEKITFHEIEEIDILEFFECDLTPQ